MKEITYKDNVIGISLDGSVVFFLCDEDGDIYESKAKSVEDAKSRIDAIEKRQGGLYNLDGELVRHLRT